MGGCFLRPVARAILLHVPYHRHNIFDRATAALGYGAGCKPSQVHERSFADSLYPTVNSRFMWSYIQKTGGLLDAAVEPPRTSLVLRSPDLLFFASSGISSREGTMSLSFCTPTSPAWLPEVGALKISTDRPEIRRPLEKVGVERPFL